MEYGLVLAGGGVRGAFQVGVWKALREMKVKISAIAGASIGAVNGALFAQGEFERVEKLWRQISIGDIVALPESMAGGNDLFSVKNFTDILAQIHKNEGLDMSPLEKLLDALIDEEKLRKSPTDFGAAVFSVTKKTGVCKFKADIPKGKMVSYLMASACMPGFKMKQVDNEKFLDGGVSNNMPINMMIEKGADNIITVDVRGVGVCRSVNLAGRNVISIKCSEPQTGLMEFDPEGIERSMKEGYFECMKAFGRYRGDIYSFDAKDYGKARGRYSQELLEGLEKAAKVFDIDPFKLYGVEELITLTMSSYSLCAEKFELKENVLEKIRQLGDNAFVVWLVKTLESGKSDFLLEKLSVLGSNYDAASAIMYFKRIKRP